MIVPRPASATICPLGKQVSDLFLSDAQNERAGIGRKKTGINFWVTLSPPVKQWQLKRLVPEIFKADNLKYFPSSYVEETELLKLGLENTVIAAFVYVKETTLPIITVCDTYFYWSAVVVAEVVAFCEIDGKIRRRSLYLTSPISSRWGREPFVSQLSSLKPSHLLVEYSTELASYWASCSQS